ncbi:hypothetical protein Dimus_007546, partial [Dionaea muscipula]
MPEDLPDELWRRIMEVGVQGSSLTYKDLCCLSISCRRLRRLSDEDSLWSYLLSSDFSPTAAANPLSASSSSSSSTIGSSSSRASSPKILYRIRYERDRARKMAAHRRAVLRVESIIAQHTSKLQELQDRRKEEVERLQAAAAELSRLQKARQASVALNVWQPEVVRGRQKQLVEQCVVPVDSRINTLQMEIKLCKQQIVMLDKTNGDEKLRLETAKEQLISMKYHPLRDYPLTGGR